MNEDWQRYIDAYEQAARSMIALGGELDAADWGRDTECPQWSVKDQFSHVLGIERWLVGEADGPARTTDNTDLDVVAFRSRTGEDILTELRGVVDRRLAALRSGAIDLAEQVDTPFGRTMPYGELMMFRAFDVWVHQQDVRRAVGRPGDLDTPGAECAARILTGGLGFVVGKRAGATPGQSVVFDVFGPVARRLRFVVDDDGRARPTDDADGGPTVALRMDWETFVRLGTGRCGPEAASVEVTGDADLAVRTLAGMAMVP